MLIEIYILLIIIGFILFLVSILSPAFLPEDSTANIWILAMTLVIFATLFFASFNIQTSDTVTSAQNVTLLNNTDSRTVYEYMANDKYFTEQAFAWMFLAMSLLCLVLLVVEIWQQSKNLPSY